MDSSLFPWIHLQLLKVDLEKQQYEHCFYWGYLITWDVPLISNLKLFSFNLHFHVISKLDMLLKTAIKVNEPILHTTHVVAASRVQVPDMFFLSFNQTCSKTNFKTTSWKHEILLDLNNFIQLFLNIWLTHMIPTSLLLGF